MQRGDIVICALQGDYGKPRPAVIVQSNLFNETHASVVICPVTTHIIEAPLFRIPISPTLRNGLKHSSQIMIDKISVMATEKLQTVIGALNNKEQQLVDVALKLWLQLA